MLKKFSHALVAVCAVAAATLAAGCEKPPASANSPSAATSLSAGPTAASASPTQSNASKTPLGQFLASGKPLFPHNRVVAYYGAAGVPAMGVLGSTSPAGIAPRLERQAQTYDKFGRPVIPAF